jgi:parvulin-like peptidyl-prolyl isomerase
MRRFGRLLMDQVDLSRLARYRLLRPYLRQVLLEEAIQEISLSEEELAGAQRTFFQENGVGDQEALEAFCRYHQLTVADLNYQIACPLRLRAFAAHQFGAQAESRFLKRKPALDQVVYSLLRTADGGLARELCLQIREGEATFADLAALHAEGPERATCGIIGPVPLDQGHPDLVNRLRTAEPGVVLDPFAIESWWTLVRLESFVPAVFGPESAQAMTQEMLEEWLEQQVDQRLRDLQILQTPPQPKG